MPTYHYHCTLCDDEFEQWQSMTEAALTTHDDCGGRLQKVYLQLVTVGVGKAGEDTRVIEAREARWQKDMPAYARFRAKGLQPPGIDGCDHLEATAQSDLEVRSGGRLKVNEREAREKWADAQDIMKGRL
jgi:putative FmdB family regulatory protein